MPNPILSGIPINMLQGTAGEIAQELDQSRLVDRSDGAVRGDGVLSPSELAAALQRRDSFSPEERAQLDQMAAMLGISAGPATPANVKRTWQDRTRIPHDRNIFQAIAVKDQLYTITGEDRYVRMHRYQPESDAWIEVPRPATYWWGHCQDAAIAECGDQLYALGGGETRQNFPWCFRYDPTSKAWNRIADFQARLGVGAAEADGKLYAIGGTTASKGVNSWYSAKSGLVGTAQVYDPATNQWSSLPDLPAPRAYAGVIGWRNMIYVVGGIGADGKPTNRVDIFNTATGTWLDPKTIPSKVANPSLFIQDHKLCVTGGHGENHTAMRAIETLDPLTGEIGELAPVKGEDAGHVTVARVGDRLFALGSDPKDGGGHTAWLREYAPEPGSIPAATTVLNVISNNTNVTNLTNVDITNVITNITNEVTLNQVTDNSITNIRVIDNSTDIDVAVLTYLSGRFCGFSDPDFGFFLRTELDGQPLIGVGQDQESHRVLFGRARGKRGALPPNSQVTLYHPETQKTCTLRSDANGQFAQPLPDDLHGRAYLFVQKGDERSGAAAIELP